MSANRALSSQLTVSQHCQPLLVVSQQPASQLPATHSVNLHPVVASVTVSPRRELFIQLLHGSHQRAHHLLPLCTQHASTSPPAALPSQLSQWCAPATSSRRAASDTQVRGESSLTPRPLRHTALPPSHTLSLSLTMHARAAVLFFPHRSSTAGGGWWLLINALA